MPELPEVETIRRQLVSSVVGLEVAAIDVIDPKWTEPQIPERVSAAAAGQKVEALSRRGKYLLVELESGHTLVLHLRMTGNLILAESFGGDPIPIDPRLGTGDEGTKHLRARIVLDEGRELRFTDPRRFGRGIVLDPGEVEPYFSYRLGVEPLSDGFDPELLGMVAAGRTAPLKSFLLDQSAIAGIGNIYADEALFRAKLHPLSPTGSMRPEHHLALHRSVREALEAGIAKGGASIDDYRDSRGASGQMQDEFLVHRREGRPCPSCGETIARIVVSGRSTYHCRSCQVRLRRRPRPRR